VNLGAMEGGVIAIADLALSRLDCQLVDDIVDETQRATATVTAAVPQTSEPAKVFIASHVVGSEPEYADNGTGLARLPNDCGVPCGGSEAQVVVSGEADEDRRSARSA